MKNSEKKKILLVDDDDGIVDAVKMILEDEGFDVTTIEDGNKVLKTVRVIKPDLVLLDLLLSGTDGREILKELKKNKVTATIPVIMISAHPTARDSAFESGADGFLAKPFDAIALVEMAKKYIHEI